MAEKSRHGVTRKGSGYTRNQVLNYIIDFIDEHGYPPTTREICDGIGVTSTATVNRHVHVLRDDGFIAFEDGKNRTITIK